MNVVEVFNEQLRKVKEIEELKPLLLYALDRENIMNAECNVIIIDNKKIREINKIYRKIDRETDVISFALEDEKQMPIIEDHRILGDIYISLEQAEKQAFEYGHSLKRELCFLAIHGLLHLLGYDHMEKEDEKIMFQKQKELLDDYGIVRTFE